MTKGVITSVLMNFSTISCAKKQQGIFLRIEIEIEIGALNETVVKRYNDFNKEFSFYFLIFF